MRVRVTPQYFQGQKLSDRQKADGPKLYGMLTLASEGGRKVMRLADKPSLELMAVVALESVRRHRQAPISCEVAQRAFETLPRCTRSQ